MHFWEEELEAEVCCDLPEVTQLAGAELGLHPGLWHWATPPAAFSLSPGPSPFPEFPAILLLWFVHRTISWGSPCQAQTPQCCSCVCAMWGHRAPIFQSSFPYQQLVWPEQVVPERIKGSNSSQMHSPSHSHSRSTGSGKAHTLHGCVPLPVGLLGSVLHSANSLPVTLASCPPLFEPQLFHVQMKEILRERWRNGTEASVFWVKLFLTFVLEALICVERLYLILQQHLKQAVTLSILFCWGRG